MTHARTQHPNASLTPRGHREMVACAIERGWTIEKTVERFQVDAKTVRANGATGSAPKARRVCWIVRLGLTGHRTQHRSRVDVASSSCESSADGAPPASGSRSAAPGRLCRRS